MLPGQLTHINNLPYSTGLTQEKSEVLKIAVSGRWCIDNSSVSKKAANSNICRRGKTKLWDMQDSRLRRKTENIQPFANRKAMKKFHDALKTIYRPKSSEATTLLSADGSTHLLDKEAVLKFPNVMETSSSLSGKASCADAVPVNIYKSGGQPMTKKLTEC